MRRNQEGRLHGKWLGKTEVQLHLRESNLVESQLALEHLRLAALDAVSAEAQQQQKPATVLQTYTVSLHQLKELEKWKAPLLGEYTSLVHTTRAIKPTTQERLKADER